jgi:hypothetical protein
LSLLLAIVVFAIAFHSLVDEPRRKSPAEFRRAKRSYKAEAAARRYAALPATEKDSANTVPTAIYFVNQPKIN